MRIGIAGVGRMGAAIAERLIGQGHAVTVWNRTAARTEPLKALGAAVAATPAELVGAIETVVTILTDAAALDAVYGGPEGLLAGPVAGKLVIEMSTVRPGTEEVLAGRVRAAGAAFVECPVGGTVAPTKDGKLLGFAGGEEADVERARPVLDALCRRVEHVGPVGAGARVKLAINLPLAVYWQALGEALALCRGVGLDGSRIVSIFADTSGGPNVLKARGEVVAKALDGAEMAGTFDIDGLRKDLGTMLAEAEGLGVALPVAQAARDAYDAAAAAGLGRLDGAQQSAFWRKRGAV
jgi:3-hydroxyisobutyrate dehydrogenase